MLPLYVCCWYVVGVLTGCSVTVVAVTTLLRYVVCVGVCVCYSLFLFAVDFGVRCVVVDYRFLFGVTVTLLLRTFRLLLLLWCCLRCC